MVRSATLSEVVGTAPGMAPAYCAGEYPSERNLCAPIPACSLIPADCQNHGRRSDHAQDGWVDLAAIYRLTFRCDS
jgi:hypothetical protein